MASHHHHHRTQGREIHRTQEIQAAIAKAAELRALHAALLHSQLQGGSNASSPVVSRFAAAAASPSLLKGSSQAAPTEDYPVFTPSYEEDPIPGYQNFCPENRSLSQTWRGMHLDGEGEDDDATDVDCKHVNNHSTTSGEQRICSTVEHLSNRNLSMNHAFLGQTTPTPDTLISLSKRTASGENGSITACNSCTPATLNRGDMGGQKSKNGSSTDPVQHQHQTIRLPEKHKGAILSWLFPKSRKKTKPVMSPNKIEPENMSQLLKDWGLLSMEALKRELLEANENRDAALAEVSVMRSSLLELQHKLVSLETYCEDLKKSLKQTMHAKNSHALDKPNLSKRIKAIGNVNKDNPMPVSHEVMVEGFLQIVSEARLSIKQFCKTLIHHIGESDDDLLGKLNLLLEPHQITAGNKSSRALLYHLEALVNQSLYQDFENCVFQKNGSPRCLDPHKDRQGNFSNFVALRNLSWNDVLQKGTKYYSEDFSRFCDQKMSCIVSMLNWSKPWPEQLLQCFFVAAKCIWLLHLLSFSFSPPLMILRVDENHDFDPLYMEDVLLDKHITQTPKRVKIMVMPGFYVQDRVLRCRVLCRT